MLSPPRLLRRAWLLVLPLGAGLIFWFATARIEHIRQVTDLAEWSADVPTPDANSPTGYTDGWRRLVLPDHGNEAYQWIAQTQRMLAGGDARLRRVDYDNAPEGRLAGAPALYRWCLAGVAQVAQLFHARPLALSVEDAALWTNPLLQFVLLVSLAWFVARVFGALAASIVGAGIIGFFPLGGAFVAGSPGPDALALLCAAWSLIPIVAAVGEIHRNAHADLVATTRRVRRWFAIAGIAGGVGLWTHVDYQWQRLAGVVLGGLAVAWLGGATDRKSRAELPWGWWGLCGSATSLLGYAIENLPDNLTLRFNANHPLFALSWLGASGLLAAATRWFGSGQTRPRRSSDFVKLALTVLLAIAAPAAIVWFGERSWLPDHPASTRLAGEAGGIAAPNFAAWVTRDGFNAATWATVLPLLLAALALGVVFSPRNKDESRRASLVVALGPALLTAIAGWSQLRAWNFVDVAALALGAVLVAEVNLTGGRALRRMGAVAAIAAASGLLRYWPRSHADAGASLSELEVQGVIERDLAHWLARRAGDANAIVLAPPNLTVSLSFHGGLRGIGTLDPENHDGFAAATRMASATSWDEAATLLQQRDVAFIVMPSWDPFLQQYAQLGLRAALGTSRYEKSFVAELQRWNLPRWLRPVPYRLPNGSGFSDKSVAVFEIVPEQSAPTALGRLAGYFIETGRRDLALSLRDELRRYPADVGALVASAEIEAAAGETAAFHRAIETLKSLVAAGADRRLSWDRRLALAIVLAQAREIALAREQVRRCVDQADEKKLRRLSTASLVRLFALCKITEVEFTDPVLRPLAMKLQPPDLREGARQSR
jgi:hypothetical protein